MQTPEQILVSSVLATAGAAADADEGIATVQIRVEAIFDRRERCDLARLREVTREQIILVPLPYPDRATELRSAALEKLQDLARGIRDQAVEIEAT